ncbi:putative chitinase 10, partial [Pseudolycoriella hygida]
CDWPDAAECEEVEIICSDGDLFPHEEDCELFYQCFANTLVVISCPEGLHFDSTRKACNSPEQAQCAVDREICDDEGLHFNKNVGECDWPDQAGCGSFENNCTEGDLIPHKDNCELFHICSSDSWLEQSCPTGLHFNPTIKQCDWPDAAQCEEAAIVCSDGDLFPHEEDCALFYQCFANTLVVISCPEGLHFDSTRKACDFPDQAQCAVDTELCEDGDLKASSEACDRFL